MTEINVEDKDLGDLADAAFRAGAASRDAEIERLRGDLQSLILERDRAGAASRDAEIERLRARAEADKAKLSEFIDGYCASSREVSEALGTTEEFDRIDREMFACGQDGWSRHMVEKIKWMWAEIERLRGELTEAEDLLLLAYQSGHREGWEPTPTTDETMHRICDWLWNRELQPGIHAAADRRLAALRGEVEK